jgi:hypothetical protein
MPNKSYRRVVQAYKNNIQYEVRVGQYYEKVWLHFLHNPFIAPSSILKHEIKISELIILNFLCGKKNSVSYINGRRVLERWVFDNSIV